MTTYYTGPSPSPSPSSSSSSSSTTSRPTTSTTRASRYDPYSAAREWLANKKASTTTTATTTTTASTPIGAYSFYNYSSYYPAGVPFCSCCDRTEQKK